MAKMITIEGGEGVGKSTQAERLAAWLRERGHEVVMTREPGGSVGAEQIRALLVQGVTERWEPITEALLHSAARRDHISRTVLPALERGAWVVCDRFIDSTMVYQGFGLGLSLKKLEMLNDFVVGGLKPHLTLVLDAPVEALTNRIAARKSLEDRYEQRERDFHERVRRGFLEIAKKEPHRVVVVDATLGVEAVASKIAEVVRERMGLNGKS
ncbi:MAG: dTMP kinase [Reyranellaceae bacterium]